MTTSTNIGEDEHVFSAKIDDGAILCTLLKTVQFKELATVFATSLGLKFTVEIQGCLQANVFLQTGLFHHYNLRGQQVTFKVNLAVLLDCISVFGISAGTGQQSSLQLDYDGYGEPLVISVVEGGVVTKCSVKTIEPDPVLNFEFTSANVQNKVIMKSEALKEVFDEVDSKSELIEIMMSPDSPFFRATTFSDYGDNFTELSKDSDLIEFSEVKKARSLRYRTSLLKPVTKALQSAEKVSLRTDNRGFLSMQFMIAVADDQPCFVEFLCAPDEDLTDMH